MSSMMNGHGNGAQMTNGTGESHTILQNGFPEARLDEGETFLFTSESVGEGHPGKFERTHRIWFPLFLCYALYVLKN